MRVRMKAQISGYRDGVEWPAVGGELVVPDAEGAVLCGNGHAEPVVSEPKTERATAPAGETRTRKPKGS